jgi:hypothetical protein
LNFKRVLCIGDLHCGHRVGLTAPKYWTQLHGDDFYRFQVESWNWYSELVESLKPIDLCIINGDAIDGTGCRSGGTELITTDVHTQCKMAVEAIEQTEAKNYVMTFGTPYHTGLTVDDEQRIADSLGADIAGHQWVNVNGLVFDVKHFIGGSSIPHGKGTNINKEALWGFLWSAHDEQPHSDIYLRSHVHWFYQFDDGDWFGMVLPPLQGKGSKFGSRKCSNIVRYGLVYFDVFDDGSFVWKRKLLRAVSQKQKAIVI